MKGPVMFLQVEKKPDPSNGKQQHASVIIAKARQDMS